MCHESPVIPQSGPRCGISSEQSGFVARLSWLADYKLFLDAPLDERARRRHDELKARGDELPLETVVDDLGRRDALDKPNMPIPEDAIVLRNEGMTPTEEVAHILDFFGETLAIGETKAFHSEAPVPQP